MIKNLHLHSLSSWPKPPVSAGSELLSRALCFKLLAHAQKSFWCKSPTRELRNPPQCLKEQEQEPLCDPGPKAQCWHFKALSILRRMKFQSTSMYHESFVLWSQQKSIPAVANLVFLSPSDPIIPASSCLACCGCMNSRGNAIPHRAVAHLATLVCAPQMCFQNLNIERLYITCAQIWMIWIDMGAIPWVSISAKEPPHDVTWMSTECSSISPIKEQITQKVKASFSAQFSPNASCLFCHVQRVSHLLGSVSNPIWFALINHPGIMQHHHDPPVCIKLSPIKDGTGVLKPGVSIITYLLMFYLLMSRFKWFEMIWMPKFHAKLENQHKQICNSKWPRLWLKGAACAQGVGLHICMFNLNISVGFCWVASFVVTTWFLWFFAQRFQADKRFRSQANRQGCDIVVSQVWAELRNHHVKPSLTADLVASNIETVWC